VPFPILRSSFFNERGKKGARFLSEKLKEINEKLPTTSNLSTVPIPPLFFFQGEGKERGEVFGGKS